MADTSNDRERTIHLPLTSLLRKLPATVPFIAPEVLERRIGYRLKLRIGANESPFGISPQAHDAMLAELKRIAWYADPESYNLRTELANTHGISPDNIMVGSGIDDLLGLVVRAFLDRGESAVASLGSYPTFGYHVLGHGGEVHRVPYHDDLNDLDALAETAAKVGARLLYIANPDNPTGTWHMAAHLLMLVDSLPEGCLLLLDEAYAEFAPTDATPPKDIIDPRLIRFRTFSKAHGMAGVRIGYAIATRETIAAFDKIRLHFGVNRVAQAGALASLGDPHFVEGVIDKVAIGRREYVDFARELGLAALPSATNFVAIDMGTVRLAQATSAMLLEQGIFVRVPSAPPLDRCIRVTVGIPPERMEFMEALRSIFASLRSSRDTD